MKPTRLAWILWALFIVGILFAGYAHADAVAVAKAGNVTITLYNEPCAIAAVANLKRRATWSEPGKVYEGCFAVSEFGVVMVYFADDRSVGAVPTGAFVAVTGA